MKIINWFIKEWKEDSNFKRLVIVALFALFIIGLLFFILYLNGGSIKIAEIHTSYPCTSC